MTSTMKQATLVITAGALMVGIPTAMAAMGAELSESLYGLVMIVIPMVGGFILGCGILVAVTEQLDNR